MDKESICKPGNDTDDVTESTEKWFAVENRGKFEIILDIVKVNTSETIGEFL